MSVTAGGDALKSDKNETDDTVGYIAVSGGTVVLDAGDDGGWAHAERGPERDLPVGRSR